jgi:RNA polymerase sigma-70 factor (ECF subfamily)
MRDAGAAEDVVQDAFVRLVVESQAWRSPRNPRAWLYRVVLNLIISRSRHAEVARRRSSVLALGEMVDVSPETALESSERSRALGATLRAVGADGRTGLILAAQGYSSRDIGEVLGRSEAATRTLICRTRQHVRRELTTLDAA